MVRADKAAAVAELTELFRSSSAGVLTEYRGLSVAQLRELRRAMGSEVTYSVVKNTLTRIAAKEAGVDAFTDEDLKGPSAIAFINGDPVEAAKGLRNFAKTHPTLVIKAGYMEGKTLNAAEINSIADLQPREVMLAMMAGAMKASLTRAAYLFAAPLSQAARTVDALRAKVEEQSGGQPGGPEEAPAVASEETPAEA
jgi:large subunit ribosomal protein L10